ncbi:MAG: Mobile element protein, partial [uncultured Thermomicrobiales bacterium]
GSADPQALPERRERRGVGLRGAVPDPDAGGRAAAGAPAARGVQRPALARPGRGDLAPAAPRPAAVAHRLPADPALARRRRLRGARPGPADAAARARGAGAAADGGGPGRAHAPVEPGERRARRRRRAQEAHGVEGPPRRGHAGAPARPDGHVGQRAGARAGGRTGRAGAGGDRRDRRGRLRGPGLHRRGRGRRRGGAGHPPGGGQAARGHARLRAAAAPLGGGNHPATLPL